MIGLLLIALGTGGIKPCVSAFGGDQFILPQQERYLAMFFSLFYFSINTGSLISTLLTPVIRDTKCFEDECFSLAFLIPAILMIVSIGKGRKDEIHFISLLRECLARENKFFFRFNANRILLTSLFFQ